MKYELTFSEGVGKLRCLKEFRFEDGVNALREVIKKIKGLLDAILSNEGVRIAIVVNRIVHYGIGRVIETRAAQGSGRIRVFLVAEAARQWLDIAVPDPAA
ncbi:MAG: hypothetical protein ABIK85_10460 [Candidatus Eisenbacteria bacterium]